MRDLLALLLREALVLPPRRHLLLRVVGVQQDLALHAHRGVVGAENDLGDGAVVLLAARIWRQNFGVKMTSNWRSNWVQNGLKMASKWGNEMAICSDLVVDELSRLDRVEPD